MATHLAVEPPAVLLEDLHHVAELHGLWRRLVTPCDAHGVALHGCGDVAVAVKRDVDAAMPEHLAGDLRVDPPPEHACRRSVAEIVKADAWQPRRFEDSIERAVQIRGSQIVSKVAALVAEHQTSVQPLCAEGETQFGLPSAMLAEGGHRWCGQRHSAALAGLWRDHLAVSATQAAQRTDDLQGPVIKVHVGPAQREQLALTQSGRDREHEQRLEWLAGDRIQKRSGSSPVRTCNSVLA